MIFLAGVSSNTNPTRPAIVALLISPTYSADRKDLMHCRSENAVFKFFRWVHVPGLKMSVVQLSNAHKLSLKDIAKDGRRL